MTDLSGRTVLITGGNGGIGLGIGRACAQAGADIVVWGRNAEKNAAAALLRPGNALFTTNPVAAAPNPFGTLSGAGGGLFSQQNLN